MGYIGSSCISAPWLSHMVCAKQAGVKVGFEAPIVLDMYRGLLVYLQNGQTLGFVNRSSFRSMSACCVVGGPRWFSRSFPIETKQIRIYIYIYVNIHIYIYYKCVCVCGSCKLANRAAPCGVCSWSPGSCCTTPPSPAAETVCLIWRNAPCEARRNSRPQGLKV